MYIGKRCDYVNLHMLVIIVDVNIFRHQVNVLGHFSLYMYVLRREKKAEHDILGATMPRPSPKQYTLGAIINIRIVWSNSNTGYNYNYIYVVKCH